MRSGVPLSASAVSTSRTDVPPQRCQPGRLRVLDVVAYEHGELVGLVTLQGEGLEQFVPLSEPPPLLALPQVGLAVVAGDGAVGVEAHGAVEQRAAVLIVEVVTLALSVAEAEGHVQRPRHVLQPLHGGALLVDAALPQRLIRNVVAAEEQLTAA